MLFLFSGLRLPVLGVSVFDISKDLSLKVEPTIINNNMSVNPIKSSSVGLQCSLSF